ncbi:phosphonate C-P lyase system protein PhnK [Roseicella aquatilis]|uniref:Phosphonate C-P lyase system protein PhnK n=2 Tax=Roseicella aquatilis TaxID=2527868 RepID=A0A4R4D4N0_9PROT|nr:phosphonate C-P lyase system protein PhnK [Roseicella aquatilis]
MHDLPHHPHPDPPPPAGEGRGGGVSGGACPLLAAHGLSLRYGAVPALDDVSLSIWPGEVVAIVGESGSGKTTLLRVLSGLLRPEAGEVLYRDPEGAAHSIHGMGEAALRRLHRSDWGFVHQNPRDGLRLGVSAGGNIGERLMATGARHYGCIRAAASDWLRRVEIDPARLDHLPRTFSGGMQQRLQIARTLVTHPRLVFMDEPTGGLDVSVQARLLDLIRGLVAELGLSVLLVTHDIAAARLLAHRMLVMRRGRVVESGLTDRVLDDPQHEYTQLLVASVLAA